jgi:predicted DsbA family dithiol-disulfide isomerase
LVKVEIWSDVLCPWCYIGKRRFETALATFAHREEVDVVWRSFELDPGAPREQVGDPVARLAAKYGMTRQKAVAAQRNLSEVAQGEGLDFHLETARSGNSFDAHRLIHLAERLGVQGQLKERLLSAYLVEGRPIGDPETLAELAGEVGMSPEQSREVLGSHAFAEEVRHDEAEASALGISGVPFFVFDRTYAVSGAQPAATFADVFDQAWDATHPFTMVSAGDPDSGSCSGDNCAI